MLGGWQLLELRRYRHIRTHCEVLRAGGEGLRAYLDLLEAIPSLRGGGDHDHRAVIHLVVGGIHRAVVGLAYHTERALIRIRHSHRHGVLGGWQLLELRRYRHIRTHCEVLRAGGVLLTAHCDLLELVARCSSCNNGYGRPIIYLLSSVDLCSTILYCNSTIRGSCDGDRTPRGDYRKHCLYRKVFLHGYSCWIVGSGGSSYFEVLETVSR